MINFEIGRFGYEQVFMVAPKPLLDAILGINFLKENNVVINLNEGRFKGQMDGSNCEHQFCYDSL